MERNRNKLKDFEANWRVKYERLLEFYKREGHCRVPARHVEADGFKLGIWVKAQREKQNKLPLERRSALDAIPGWHWKGQDAKWERGFRLLKEFVKREGHSRVPKLHMEKEYRLGVWVMHQRGAFKQGRLSPDRRKQLESLPAWFWTYNEALPTRVNVTKATKIVWRNLIGAPLMTQRELIREAARVLYKEGLIYSDQLMPDSTASEDIRLVIQKMLQKGYLENPENGYMRVVVRQPYQFRPEYWQMCVLNSCGEEIVPRDDLLIKAAHWARDKLGLKVKQFRLEGRIARELKSAIDQAIEDHELTMTPRGGILRV